MIEILFVVFSNLIYFVYNDNILDNDGHLVNKVEKKPNGYRAC